MGDRFNLRWIGAIFKLVKGFTDGGTLSFETTSV